MWKRIVVRIFQTILYDCTWNRELASASRLSVETALKSRLSKKYQLGEQMLAIFELTETYSFILTP